MLILRLLAMTRPSTTIRHLRGVKSISRQDKAQYKKIDIASSPVCQEVLNRVQVVTEVSESKDIVENILAMGQPIAVDMEGLEGGMTSMVQVCDVERNISLFRTGTNSNLYWEGGLARLLQSPEVMKIMHGSTIDCLSAYKDGVKLWNLYDTSVAFKVLQYQLHGTSIYSSNQIGFNGLCRHFGLPENPLKDTFKNILWKMIITKNGKRGLDTAKVLDDELLLYCAWDVDPLHQIHQMLCSTISPSYSHLVMQLSEVEIIRAIDSDLAKRKRNSLKNMEVCNMFLSHLPSSLTPPDLYTLLSHMPGHKHIYFSHNQGTANIILDSREEVVAAFNSFNEWGSKLGDEVKCKLVVEAHANEVVENPNEGGEDTEKEAINKDARESIDPIKCQEIIDNILEAKCPVVTDFHLYPDCSAVEIYVGVQPSIKLVITQEMVEVGGLGKLLSSNIVKVVPRLDSANVYSALKLLNSFGVEMRNVFEINTAVKSLEYMEHGQSLFKQESRSVQGMSRSLGLTMSTSRLHWHYMAYLHLVEVIPEQFREILAELTVVEIGVGTFVDSSGFKSKRRNIKTRLDGCCVHLRLTGGVDKVKQSKLKELVMTALLSKDLVMVEYMDMGRCAIVQLRSSQAVRTVMEELETREQSSDLRFSVSSPQVLKTVVEKPARPVVDMNALELRMKKNVAKLRSSGLTDNLR
eukprot:GFUD01021134.1.p1 GENE.GFUD01021134.1~~GFUD01021134.1.p1  ORF type:complete len:692 (+),score=244.74 GFUD01021134.1:1267-3342(+)